MGKDEILNGRTKARTHERESWPRVMASQGGNRLKLQQAGFELDSRKNFPGGC